METEKNKCNAPCEVYSRVTGYHRPVNLFNEGKQEEFRQRKSFDIKGVFKVKSIPELKVKIVDGKAELEEKN